MDIENCCSHILQFDWLNINAAGLWEHDSVDIDNFGTKVSKDTNFGRLGFYLLSMFSSHISIDVIATRTWVRFRALSIYVYICQRLL